MAQVVYDEEFLKLLPNKWWVNFFKKFQQIDELPNSEWKPIHQLSHFCHRYHDHYGKKYSFSLNRSPGKCPEIYMIKKVSACLGTSNQGTIREYIDWVFDRKIIPTTKKIRSIGFLTNPQFCNEFQLYRIEKKKITRVTSLPENYQVVVDDLELPVRTYGDLAFAKQAVDQNPDSKAREPYKIMFNKLYAIGFEYRMIQGLK